MSRINRANAVLQAHIMQEMLGVSCNIGLSARLQDAAAELVSTGALNHTLAVLQEPGVAELANQIGENARLESVLSPSGPAATLNQVTAQLLRDIDDHLGQLHQKAVTSLTERVLQNQGYEVRVVHGEVASGIEAFRGNETMLVAVMGHGEVLVDQLNAGDCAGNLSAFMTGMADGGAPLSHVTEVEHDPDEAPLIAQAAAAGGGDLAAGIAGHAVRGLRTKPVEATSKATGTRTNAELREGTR